MKNGRKQKQNFIMSIYFTLSIAILHLCYGCMAVPFIAAAPGAMALFNTSMAKTVTVNFEIPNTSLHEAVIDFQKTINTLGQITSTDKEAGIVNGRSREGLGIIINLSQLDHGVRGNFRVELPSGEITFFNAPTKDVAHRLVTSYEKISGNKLKLKVTSVETE